MGKEVIRKLLNSIDKRLALSKNEQRIHSLAMSMERPVDEVRTELLLKADELKPLLQKGEPELSGFYIVFNEDEDGCLHRLQGTLYFNSANCSWSDLFQCDYHIGESEFQKLISSRDGK